MRRDGNFRTDGDQGAVLVLVLVFITAIALVSTALLSQTDANLLFTAVERQNQKQVYSATAAVDYGIKQLQANSNTCGAGNLALGTQNMPFAVNGRTATWSCSETQNSSSGGVYGSDWALFLTGNNGAPIVNINGNSAHIINGSIYNGYGGNWNQNWNLSNSSPLLVVNGSVTQYQATCPLPSAIANLGPSGVTVNCETTVRATPPAREGLAASAPASASANPVAVVGDPACVAFSPGRYASAPNLDGTKVNFFRGGVYYFDSIGNWNINGSKILGGTPQLAEPRQTSLTCGDTTQGGVMFVFGGNSQFTANGSTVVELFAGNAAGGPGVSVYQVMATGGGWTTSSTGNQPMLSIDEIGANRFVAHGQVWMPNGSLKLTQGGGSNGTLQFRAGLVVSDIQNLNNANGPTNFYVTGSRTVTITGIGPLAGGETGVTVTAKAVVVIANDTTIAPRIASWRLS